MAKHPLRLSTSQTSSRFLSNLLLPNWSVASRAAEAGSQAAGLFSAPVSYGLLLSKLSRLPEDGSVGTGSGNNV